jgi:hypothetical protein
MAKAHLAWQEISIDFGFVILFIDKLQNVFLPKEIEIEIENISYN